MDLKKMDVEELLVIVWDNGAGDGYRGIQTRDVAAELTRRITEANARADRLAAEGKIPNGHVMLPGGEVVKV
ncbi:MAG: hypothetical protein ACK5X3_14495, partial [Pseudomonadota bacterium]